MVNQRHTARGKSASATRGLLFALCVFVSSLSIHQVHTDTARAQPLPPVRRVNAPHFTGEVPYAEMAIFWFGQVNSTDNYADVRVGYNDEYLQISIVAFDRYLWYDTTPDPDLNEWDGATLYLDLNGDGGSFPDPDDYRFAAQINWWEARTDYQMAFRGDGSDWVTASTPFTTTSGWRGSNFNNNDSGNDDRGWALSFYIPFASLDLPGPPADGALWNLALALHDRDNDTGSPAIADKSWPEAARDTQPETWGQLVFDPPTDQPPPTLIEGTTTIRHKLDGVVVVDAAVGGHTNCGHGLDFWSEWGEANYAGGTPVNIQNQADVADWPCFSKYYVTFPLDTIPPDRVIISATLTLHQIGSAGEPEQRWPSLIQVLTVDEDWNEATLTWNNAPLARENVSSAWVDPTSFPGWPGLPRDWDVSYAAAQAYTAGDSLRMALYEADSVYHSGKYFVSSDTGDWNAEARPTLTVVWGQPLSKMNKHVRPTVVTNGEVVTYTLSWVGSGQPLSMADTLPSGLSAPGPINSSSGNATYNLLARQVEWTGTPTVGQSVTVTFPVTVQVDGPIALRNNSVLTTNSVYTSSDEALIIVDGYSVYLPQIMRR